MSYYAWFRKAIRAAYRSERGVWALVQSSVYNHFASLGWYICVSPFSIFFLEGEIGGAPRAVSSPGRWLILPSFTCFCFDKVELLDRRWLRIDLGVKGRSEFGRYVVYIRFCHHVYKVGEADDVVFWNYGRVSVIVFLYRSSLRSGLWSRPPPSTLLRRSRLGGNAMVHLQIFLNFLTFSFPFFLSFCRRFVAGLGVGALSAIVPLYNGEAAPKNIRGAMWDFSLTEEYLCSIMY